jgi:hypothetical protein
MGVGQLAIEASGFFWGQGVISDLPRRRLGTRFGNKVVARTSLLRRNSRFAASKTEKANQAQEPQPGDTFP